MEKREDSYVLICRNVSVKRSLLTLIFIGLYWLSNVWLWNRLYFDMLVVLYWVGVTCIAYSLLIATFGKSTIEVSKEKILVERIQFLFPTKKVIELKGIEEIVCETSNWMEAYNVKAKLKSGKKIKLFETANRDDAQFLLTALDSSVKQSQMMPKEKKVSLISNKFL